MINMLGIIGCLAVVLGIVIFAFRKRLEEFGVHPNKIVTLLSVAGALLILISLSCTIIPTGYTGVRTTFGQIDEKPVQNGFSWKIPVVQSVELVNNKQQDIQFKDKVWSETVDRTAIYYAQTTVTYQINPAKSAWIFANVSSYKSNLVTQPIVASAIKSSSKTLNDSDATNRSIIEPLVMVNLQESLDEKYGEGTIVINKVTISDVDFEDSYNEAIAAKQRTQIESEQQAIENKKSIEKAEAQAQVTRTEAQAKADAEIIKAQGQAEANRLLEESLTDYILKRMYIDKWDGKLPRAVSGSDGAYMIDIDLDDVVASDTQ